MKLSKKQFEKLLRENRLVLSFLGMSNIGKTYWAKKFYGIGFEHINCDDLIEAKLAPVLKRLGYLGIKNVSRWMGQPYDERFTANQEKYLFFEGEVMEDIFAQIKNSKTKNTVIDTTGSIVHTSRNICDRLKRYSTVVYIEAPENMKENMFGQYLKELKPVIFGDVYSPRDGETVLQTLSRCYQELFSLRSALYAKYADVIIPREIIDGNTDVHQFISLIKQSL